MNKETWNNEFGILTLSSSFKALSPSGCKFANNTEVRVSLLQRHGTFDVKYQANYLPGFVLAQNGPGLERHQFSHLDCPHEHFLRSGKFILGKFVDKAETELHLTAFIIPCKHTLHIPPKIIHSNDYLQGTWRTMLGRDDVDRVILTRQTSNGNLTERFMFDFPGNLLVLPDVVQHSYHGNDHFC
ncbi:unnamed protein product [Didymodactylos carnosus]|uniref:Uncharacterized protein n=1 Tax=Didymodactylos carnosus TaxID=1234261 RepID=A0A814J8U9_9BILA|nr:unnamed protein product [Didymodactylos carnosus]CAF3804907.1 unnamed protein product [Didymodactylos carnosus]